MVGTAGAREGVGPMMSEDKVRANASDRPAFSTGTEFDAWSERFCDRCAHEDHGRSVFCPILSVAMLDERTPAEWVPDQPSSLGRQYRCVEFQPTKR